MQEHYLILIEKIITIFNVRYDALTSNGHQTALDRKYYTNTFLFHHI